MGGDVNAFRKTQEDVKLQLKASYLQKKGEKRLVFEGVQEDQGDEDVMQEISWLQNGKRPLTSSVEVTLALAKKKTANV